MEKGAVIKHDPEKAAKTGDWRYMKPKIDKKKCIGCETCAGFCPEATIEMKKGGNSEVNKKGKVADVDYYFCKGCGVCAQVCPVKCITMERTSHGG